MPAGLDADAITASLADGVLTLRIAKPQAPKPRRIEITTGGQPRTVEGTAGEQRELVGSGT